MNQKTAKNENKKRFICGGYLTHKAQPHTFARNRYYASHAPLVDIEIIQKKKKKNERRRSEKDRTIFSIFTDQRRHTHTEHTHKPPHTTHSHTAIFQYWISLALMHKRAFEYIHADADGGHNGRFKFISYHNIDCESLSLSSRPPIRVSVCARARD